MEATKIPSLLQECGKLEEGNEQVTIVAMSNDNLACKIFASVHKYARGSYKSFALDVGLDGERYPAFAPI